MRCRCCNRALTDSESTKFNDELKDYDDICDNCDVPLEDWNDDDIDWDNYDPDLNDNPFLWED